MRSKRVFGISMLLFLIGNWQIQAQIQGEADYLIKYEVEFKLDSTNRDVISKEVHRLYTGANTSYYVNEGKIRRDSIFADMAAQLQNRSGGMMRGINVQTSTMPSVNFTAEVYKDLTNSELWVQNSVARTEMHYKEPKTPLVWEHTEDTKQIGGYTALKATTSFGGRDYEAWFTLEVPILDGPYVFSGLPGLILELYDSRMDYHFSLASLIPLKENYTIDLGKEKTKKVTKEEFIKNYKKFRENPTSGFTGMMPDNFEFKDASGRTVTSRDMERRVKEDSDKKNNSIEIWK